MKKQLLESTLDAINEKLDRIDLIINDLVCGEIIKEGEVTSVKVVGEDQVVTIIKFL